MPSAKTNAARALDRLGLTYELRDYEVDASDLSAPTVAAKVGLPPSQVFKTLAARTDKNVVVMAVIAADADLDLKALARAASAKKVELLPLKEVQFVTGYVRGGVTALAAKRDFPVYLDRSALHHAVVSVSAGVRGTQIFLAPGDYAKATKATVVELAMKSAEPSSDPDR